jgi:DNA-nicking Smr family endonuclease
MTQDEEDDNLPSDNDQSLWERYTADIDKIGPANVARDDIKRDAETRPSPTKNKTGKTEENPAAFISALDNFGSGMKPADTGDRGSSAPAQIDKRTAMRLKRGQMPIDARIDLHGMYQRDAKARLLGFIAQSFGRGDRCVLVITGKGRLVFEGEMPESNTPGVIKRNFKSWLGEEPYASMILKIEKAQIKDGGEGAYYILLRRSR